MSNEQTHILIVDDDITLGRVLQQSLESLDDAYDVRLARDADEALAHISRRHFDLVVTDIKMEGLSGLQLLEALQHVDPDTRTVVITAFGTAEIEERSRMLGVYAYLAKPFTISKFQDLISDVLKAEAPSIPKILPPSELQSLLVELRTNTGAHATFFIKEDTADVLGVASNVDDLDLTSLAKALVEIPQRMTAEVARVFGGGSGFRRSQYIGEVFNLSTYRLAGGRLLIVVYEHHVKEGIVSFYARQALERLSQILKAETPSGSLDNGSKSQDSASLETPSSTSSQPVMPESDQDSPSEPLDLEQALAMGLLNDDFVKSLGGETQ